MHGLLYRRWRSLGHRLLTHQHRRRLLAAAHAGRSHHAHALAQRAVQRFQQIPGTGHGAADAVAHPHRQGGRQLVVAQHLKMVVEAGHLKDLGHWQAHFGGQRHQMALKQGAVMVVEPVQVFDQQVTRVAVFGRTTDERMHVSACLGIDLTAFELVDATIGARTGAQLYRRGKCHR